MTPFRPEYLFLILLKFGIVSVTTRKLSERFRPILELVIESMARKAQRKGFKKIAELGLQNKKVIRAKKGSAALYKLCAQTRFFVI